MHPFRFHLPTRIVFGSGRLAELSAILPPGDGPALIVTDRNVARRTAAVSTAASSLSGRGTEIFSDVPENPDFECVERGAETARRLGARLVIGIGGGSPMDAAKGIALLGANGTGLGRFLEGAPPENAPLPLVCIPTTAGTGSEVTPYAVFTDMENQAKIGYSHPGLFPAAALVDPELTYSMPVEIAVNTGLDVLSHALESYLSTDAFEMNDVLALHVLDTVLVNLEAAAAKEKEAMDRMAYAAMLAGVAITQSGTILLHIMGYCLTTFHDVPHGRATAALLPAVLDFLRDHSPVQGKIGVLDGLFAPYGGPRSFVEAQGVPTRIASYGVREDELEMYARKVIIKGDVRITPAPVTVRDIEDIYRAAL
jgi:alcohol dehydrogenase class IV